MSGEQMPVERWLESPEVGLWIRDAGSRMAYPARVRDLVPETFEAFARIFHPLSIDGRETRWDQYALSRHQVPTRTMQLTDVLDVESVSGSKPRWKGGWSYQLPRLQWHELGPLMQRHTLAETFFIGIWEGRGSLPFNPSDDQVLAFTMRRYVLMEIPISDWHATTGVSHAPDLCWPADRAWFMGGDLDVSSTYVGGSRRLIDKILRHGAFEALEAFPDDPVVTI